MIVIPAKNYTKCASRRVSLIVIHTAEVPEKKGAAKSIANYFAGKSGPAPQASAHYCVDEDEVVQSVPENDIAWHAPGANSNGIGIELAGYAKQTAADWSDPYSQATLHRAAVLVAELCRKYSIPVTHLESSDVLKNMSGITGHGDVSNAYKKSTHWDPGPNFPWGRFLDMILEVSGTPAPIAVKDHTFEEWPVVECQGVKWHVCPDYVGGVGIGEAINLAKSKGCELPSPALVEAIWKAADLKIEPMPRQFKLWTQDEMSSPAVMADQAKKIEAAVGGRPYTLLAGSHKDVVVVNGKYGLYGWHRLNGDIIQPFYAKHALAWRDYSQGLRLCRRLS